MVALMRGVGAATPCQVLLPEGTVRVEACESGNVAVLTFESGYGEVEVARGPWEVVFRRLSELREDGVPLGPAHVPGQPRRWTLLPHDHSLRSSVPGGHLHIVACGRNSLLLFADGLGRCAAVAIGSDVRSLQGRAMTWTPRGHARWAIFFRGRLVVFQAASRHGVIAVARTERAVIRALPLANEVPTLRLELHEDGRTEVLADVPLLLSDLEMEAILWSDGSERGHGSPHGQQRTPAPTWPRDVSKSRPAQRGSTGAITPLQSPGSLEGFVHQRGEGRTMRELVVARMALLADLGVQTLRCRASGPKLRALLEHEHGPLPGSTRAFRYVRHQLEVAGILLREGDEFVLPLAEIMRKSDRPGDTDAVSGPSSTPPTSPSSEVEPSSTPPSSPEPAMESPSSASRTAAPKFVGGPAEVVLASDGGDASGAGARTPDGLGGAWTRGQEPQMEVREYGARGSFREDDTARGSDPTVDVAVKALAIATSRGVHTDNACFILVDALREMTKDGLFDTSRGPDGVRGFLRTCLDREEVINHRSMELLAMSLCQLCDTHKCDVHSELPPHVIAQVDALLRFPPI